MTNPMPDPQDPDDAMYQFVDEQPEDEYPQSPDSSLSHFTTRQQTPEDISRSLPVVVTKTAHGLQNGQQVRFTKLMPMPFANATGMYQLNNNAYYVGQATANAFSLFDAQGRGIDGRNYDAYISGGQFTVTGPTLPVVNPSHFPPPGDPPFPPE